VQVTELKVEWGHAVNPQLVAEALKKDPAIKAVYVQASETSTGVSHDVKALGEIVKGHDQTILVVDAITALGVFDIKTDAWGLDVVITGSQKALMLPPELAFVSVSEKAWAHAEKAKNAAFYFNFKKERESQVKNQTAFTPTVSLIIGLQARLAIAGNALFPSLTGEVMKLINRVLPRAIGVEGDELKSGHEARDDSHLPRWMARFAESPVVQNNEM